MRERLWLGAKKRRQDAGATDGACVVLEVGAGRGEPRLCKDIRRIDLAEMGRSVLRPYMSLVATKNRSDGIERAARR